MMSPDVLGGTAGGGSCISAQRWLHVSYKPTPEQASSLRRDVLYTAVRLNGTSPSRSPLNTSNEARNSSFCPPVSLWSHSALGSAAFPPCGGKLSPPKPDAPSALEPRQVSTAPAGTRGWQTVAIAPCFMSSLVADHGHCSLLPVLS